jgi:molybdopterin/thiamine biosynthesis adenylyltransferase
MNSVVTFEQSAVEELQRRAASDSFETCASGLIAPAGRRNGYPRYVVRELLPVPESAYQSRSQVSAVLSPGYCIDLSNRARKAGLGIVIAHTHPGDHPMQTFSSIDDAGEACLKEYFERRGPSTIHISALFTKNSGLCRQLGSKKLAGMQVVGKDVSWLNANHDGTTEPHPRFNRQVLAFGSGVQKTLGSLRVAIVGAGGTGSFIATELAYLGLADFLLVDPDVVDESNLNRLLGATHNDVGKFKVEQMGRWIKSINPEASCDELIADVVEDEVAKRLLEVDFIFLCTDSHASRAVVNQIAYQYLIPTIDVGVAIHATDGLVKHVVGRTQMITSGLPCLLCSGWIDSNQVRIEMMRPDQRQADPYFKGEGVPQPAVISLNGAVSSTAVTTFLSAVTAIPSQARLVLYDAIRGSMRPTVMTPHPECIVCSSSGAIGKGDTWSLPTRRHVSN